MFTLKNLFSTSNPVETDDLMSTKKALNKLGYYDIPPHRGLDDWTDDATFDGLKRFQRDNGLKVDGLMRPGGPTESAINRNLMRGSSSGSGNNGYDPNQPRDDISRWTQVRHDKSESENRNSVKKIEISGEQNGNVISDFWDNFQDMKEANFIGGDKYFHCKANCQSSQRGYFADRLAESMGNLREVYGVFKGDSPEDNAEDQTANRFGRNAGYWSRDKSCRDLCEPHRPKGLPEKY